MADEIPDDEEIVTPTTVGDVLLQTAVAAEANAAAILNTAIAVRVWLEANISSVTRH